MNTYNENDKRVIRLPGWAASIMLLVMIAVIAVVLFLQFKRYEFIGASLQKGDTASAALLFTPELSTSISALLK
jgi:hypothetical protein